ncbi:MAG: Uma2 family endonuclease [Dehalococcoidia bacterium]|nr:Uma2 family endonuclease [Dehalococcoidia bacterium]
MSAPSDMVAAAWLETGDRMDREEFHRRYELAAPDFRAELVEGVVYVASPVRYGLHDEQTMLVREWLAAYRRSHPETRTGHDASVFLDDHNEYHPDAFLFRTGPGASLREGPDHYLRGAPELVVEVSASTLSRDLNDKKDAYERNGVREYIVWRVLQNAVDWFRLDDGAFARVQPGSDGIIESAVFPGLRLDVPALLAMDSERVLATLVDSAP